MKRLLLVISLLLTGALLLHRSWKHAPQPQARTATVQIRTVGRTLVEHGWLVSVNRVPVTAGATGDIQEILATGTRVQAGQVILRVDAAQAREQLEDVQYALHDNRQDKLSHEATYRYIEHQEANRLNLLRVQRDLARIRLAEAEAGLPEEDRRLLEIERELAELDLEDARDQHQRQQRLFDKGFISQAMLDPYARREATAQAAVEEVEARLRLEEKGAPPEERLELKRQVERLEAQLERGRKATERALQAEQEWIDVAEARIQRSIHDRENLERELAEAEIRAPDDGVLALRVHYDRSAGGWADYKPGVKVYHHDRVADIVDLGSMDVEVMIHEADIQTVHVGTPAVVRLPAHPGRRFPGRVAEAGGVGRDRADVAPMGYEYGRSGVTMFNATIECEEPDVELRPGMSALVELVVLEPKPRPVLPLEAVHKEDGAYVVTAVRDGTHVQQPVKGLPVDEGLFAVEDGLTEGDRVLVPHGREDTP